MRGRVGVKVELTTKTLGDAMTVVMPELQIGYRLWPGPGCVGTDVIFLDIIDAAPVGMQGLI
jgi:hypothetical protein